jgi:hypothetical protein
MLAGLPAASTDSLPVQHALRLVQALAKGHPSVRAFLQREAELAGVVAEGGAGPMMSAAEFMVKLQSGAYDHLEKEAAR